MKKVMFIPAKFRMAVRSKNCNTDIRCVTERYNLEIQFNHSFTGINYSSPMLSNDINPDLSFSIMGKKMKFRKNNKELIEIIHPVQLISKTIC